MSANHARPTFRPLLAVLATTFVLLGSLSSPPPAAFGQGPSAEFPVFYLIVALPPGGAPTLLSTAFVYTDHSLQSLSSSEFDDARAGLLAAPTNEKGLAVTVRNSGGQPIFQRIYPAVDVIRGEFHGEPQPGGGWAIEGVRFAASPILVVARVPALADAEVSFESTAGTLAVDTLELLDQLTPEDREQVTQNGLLPAGGGSDSLAAGTDNRVDLLIMGDGYTAAQQQKFNTDAAAIEQSFLTLTPYNEYRNYLRVTKLFVTSAQSGADHPPYVASCTGDNPACCGDVAAQSDPLAGTYVNTALGSRYCAFNVHRLLVPNTSAVLAAAAAVPSWDQIIVLVNDATYGGSGSPSIGTVSLDPSAVQIAQHEYGHSFTRLADEYDSPFPGYPACSDTGSGPPACEANVTNQTNPSLLKWSPWVSGSTPIPTPEQPPYANVVGLFEGARYLTSGMFRERDADLMKSLGTPFGEVCRQEYVLRLYRGGWGEPASGIANIEPGSAQPTASSFRKCAGAVTMSVVTLQPQSGPAAAVSWSVGGNVVPGATQPSFSYSSSSPGTTAVTVSVTDATTFVHPAMANGELTSAHSWQVETLPNSLTLQNRVIAGNEVHRACDSITAGPALNVASTGDVVLQAGTTVNLRPGFSVTAGGRLRVNISSVFNP